MISSQRSEMQVPLLILDSLDELGADEFKRFRWNLTQPVLDGCRPIRKGCLEAADRQDTVSRMIDSYGEESSVDVAVEILKRMNLNNAAEKLQNTCHAAGSAAAQKPSPPPTPPSGGTPAAGASLCAQGRSIIVAPNIAGQSSGVTINMNVN